MIWNDTQFLRRPFNIWIIFHCNFPESLANIRGQHPQQAWHQCRNHLHLFPLRCTNLERGWKQLFAHPWSVLQYSSLTWEIVEHAHVWVKIIMIFFFKGYWAGWMLIQSCQAGGAGWASPAHRHTASPKALPGRSSFSYFRSSKIWTWRP